MNTVEKEDKWIYLVCLNGDIRHARNRVLIVQLQITVRISLRCVAPRCTRHCRHSSQSRQSRRMKANVVRVLGKQGTGALVLSSTRRAWLRRRPQSPLLTLASHVERERLAPPHSPRHFTSSPVRALPSNGASPEIPTNTTFEDPSRKGLFYHLVPPPTPLSATRPVFAVSLLADTPPSPESSTVLGWLPAETPGDDCNAGLNDFVENRALRCPSLHFDVRHR